MSEKSSHPAMQAEALWNLRVLMFFWLSQFMLTGWSQLGASYYVVNIFEIGLSFSIL
jgi:hypothetical protein